MKYLVVPLFAVCLGAAAATPPVPVGCLIEPHRSADVGSPVVGVVESVFVERGDRVTKGQALATLRADVEKMSLAVAQSRALAVGEVQAAEANAALARQKLARAQDLARREFISGQALEQASAEAVVADNRLAQVREQRGIYAREAELARAQLGLRTIRSPSSGIVADRFLSAGERVEERPIFRVAVVDPLRVEVVLPASLFASVRRGMSMTVQPDFPGAQARTARIAIVDQLIEGASNTFRARLELANPDGALPAGVRCRAELAAPGADRPRLPVAAGAAAAVPVRRDTAFEALHLRPARTLGSPTPPRP